MRPIYLTGTTIYLRAMLSADKERAVAWFPGPYPVNAPRAEEFLKETHKEMWKRNYYLGIARIEGDEIIGGVTVSTDLRHGRIRIRTAPTLPDASRVRAEALELLIPWLRDEAEMITTTVDLAADDHEVINAAEGLGMVPSARLRQWVARPGGRVDQILYQALNPHWERRDASGQHA